MEVRKHMEAVMHIVQLQFFGVPAAKAKLPPLTLFFFPFYMHHSSRMLYCCLFAHATSSARVAEVSVEYLVILILNMS